MIGEAGLRPSLGGQAACYADAFVRLLRQRRAGSPDGPARTCLIAGLAIRLCFSTDELARQLMPALQHLVSTETAGRPFEVFVAEPATVPEVDRLLARADSLAAGEIVLGHSSNSTLILQHQGRVLSLIDWRQGAGALFVSDAESIPYLSARPRCEACSLSC